MKRIDKFIDYAIFALLGIALAYFVDSLVFVFLPTMNVKITHRKKVFSKNNDQDIERVILSKNVFGVDIGINKSKVVSIAKAKVVSSINGYKLVGFIRGNDPMVLLKKGNKPVVIVTKNKGLNKLWYLYKIADNGVYLKNKKTGEIKLFQFKNQNSSAPALMFAGEENINGGSSIEKVKVPKSILSQVDDLNVLLRQINIVPVFRNGRAYGYRINYLSPNSVLSRIGLRVGDIIVSINGQPTTDPSSLMGLYAQLKDLNSVSINLIRNSQKKTIFVQIE